MHPSGRMTRVYRSVLPGMAHAITSVAPIAGSIPKTGIRLRVRTDAIDENLPVRFRRCIDHPVGAAQVYLAVLAGMSPRAAGSTGDREEEQPDSSLRQIRRT